MKMAGNVLETAQSMLDGDKSIEEIAEVSGVSISTVYRNISEGKLELYIEYKENIIEEPYFLGEWILYEHKLDEIVQKVLDEGVAKLETITETGRKLGSYVLDTYGSLNDFLDEANLSELSPYITKKCGKCSEWVSINEYYRQSESLYGIIGTCRRCELERKEPIVRRWRSDNPDKVSLYVRSWQDRNPDAVKEAATRRRARLVGLPSDFDIGTMRNLFGSNCALTGGTETHLDHFIPLSWGHGGSTNGNVYPLESVLNISKNDRNPFEWFEEVKEERGLGEEKFNNLVEKLAGINGMSVARFKEYVYWCEYNKI